MPKLSPVREFWPILQGLKLRSRGKVRDTYELGNGLLLVVATDAISIFDFVLNALIPMKGYVLTAMSHFNFKMLADEGIPTHFVAAGAGIDEYFPEGFRGNTDLQARSMVVVDLAMSPFEAVFREYLTGSGLKDYLRDGIVCGHRLPPGLHDGSKLDQIIDTPTTKAEVGHDEPLDAEAIRKQYPLEIELGFRIFRIISKYARKRGCIFADTKFEFGRDANGVVVLGDEVGTPDSSRFWLLREWAALQASSKPKAPTPYDKQAVRNWGIERGIDPGSKMFDPAKPQDVDTVHLMTVPDDVIQLATDTYRYIFWLLTGRRIDEYLRDELGVEIGMPDPNECRNYTRQ